VCNNYQTFKTTELTKNKLVTKNKCPCVRVADAQINAAVAVGIVSR